jgi:glycosyltransferase involved in cell wall biosynthesis
MRIAFISFIKDPWGGSEELWAAAAEEALSAGHDVIITAIKLNVPSPKLEAFAKKGAILQYRRGFINPAWTQKERILRKIIIFIQNKLSNPFRELFAARPDMIVFTGGAYAMLLNKELFDRLATNPIPYLLNIQVNVEYGRPINNEESGYLHNVYEKAASVIFVSERNRQTAERHLLKTIHNARILRNPVNLGNMEMVPMPASKSPIRLALTANLLVNHKGQDLAFEIMRMPKWKNRNLELHLYGSGYDDEYLKKMADFFGITDKVHFHGKVSDIREVWKQNHAMLLPSLNEGMPLAIVEAMICGRPVITTDVGGNTEWIRDGVEGFIAGGANIAAIEDALERAWQSISEWEKMGQAAHQRAIALHDPRPGSTLLQLILQHGRRS